MNKVRVIDLLNKIANGEEVPELVKYNGIIYNYVAIYRHGMRYIDLDETDENFRYLIFNVNNLNEEVEILDDDYLEETKKEDLINHLVKDCGCVIEDTPKEDNKIEKIDLPIPSLSPQLIFLSTKINEIIDRLNGE